MAGQDWPWEASAEGVAEFLGLTAAAMDIMDITGLSELIGGQGLQVIRSPRGVQDGGQEQSLQSGSIFFLGILLKSSWNTVALLSVKCTVRLRFAHSQLHRRPLPQSVADVPSALESLAAQVADGR